ncbi:MAG: dephospho-CoA kinase [Bacteroidales bacterium]|jgi:dephospho-CoA kinase|nr:dephospho-CoA kinase [Bacteroidales bacterium]
MIKIALTGGIGTGKSYISLQFVKMNIPVYEADKEAKKLYERENVKKAIFALFPEVVTDDHKIDFNVLSAIVFTDQIRLQLLNKIIHPLVMDGFDLWAKQQQREVVILESAIIFENNLQSLFDLVILVDAPQEFCIQRIKLRNPTWSEIEIQQRICTQLSQNEKKRLADIIIDNEKDENSIIYRLQNY